ncbi:MAG: sulfotransferase family 2 domain-containing protein [Silicimonas sp.]|jgi:hypothetical protein|nr:sulfotransferase family 2 domain-containing protein [Silicimonas sp.]
MIISPGRGYVFVHIPKTGGTSLAHALEARARADDILIGDTPKARRRAQRVKRLAAPGRLWKHSKLADIDTMPDLPDPAFVFTLVRNPWDRVASLYHWARVQSFDHPLIRRAQAQSFDAFLSDPFIRESLARDTAASYVTDRAGRLRCNAFIRLEHLATDLEPLETHLGFKLELPHINATPHPGAAELYTAETQALVARLFADDIRRFDYAFPA